MKQNINEYLSLENTKYMNVMAVIDSTGIINNDKPIKDFFENVKKEYPSRIVLEKYTLEGEPTFKIIEYNGKQIKFIDDRSKTIDKYIKKFKGNKFIENINDKYIRYDLFDNDKFITKIISYRVE